jgi:H+-transporting ATPase
MAEPNTTAPAPAVNTPIESGNFNEKETRPADDKTAAPPAKPKVEDEEEEDEDIDALIEDLESQDGHEAEDEEEVCFHPT